MAATMAAQEREMRRIPGIVLCVFLWSLIAAPQTSAQAAAVCGGADLVAQMKEDNRAAYDALFKNARAVPNGRGKFWRVSYEGVPRSYLYGTFHDTEIAREPLKAGVESALDGARLLMVELTAEEDARLEARMASDPSFVIDRNQTGVIGRLTKAELEVVEKKLAERGVPLALADKLRAPILFSLIGVPQCILGQMQAGAKTLDKAIMARAADAGIPIKGLETYEQAIGSVTAIPKPTMDLILLEGLRSLGSEEDTRRTSVELYRESQIAAIWEFNVMQSAETLGMERSRQMLDQLGDSLLDARNKSWVDVMTPELQKGGVFAAFGAMHLIGPNGIVELLRDKGFNVVRLDG
jgi:uncharacterized protein YbaP (TraB family)